MEQWAEILDAIAQRLVEDRVVSALDRVFAIATSQVDDLPHLTGDRDIMLRVKGMTRPPDIAQGAGRLARVYRNLDVILRSRDSRDKFTEAEQWLKDAQLGHLRFEREVFNALDMFHPEDDDGALLIGEPMRFLRSADPERKIKSQGKIQGWGTSVMMFELMFEPELQNPERQ